MTAKSWPEDGSLMARTERVSLRLHSEEAKVPQEDDVIAKGARALVMLKIAVFLLLVLSAIIISSFTYVLINEQEKDEYESRFIQDSNKIIEQFLQQIQLKFWTCYSLSVAYTTDYEANPQAWPYVTLPRFQVQTFGSTAVSRSSAISFSPFVTDENRGQWETYAKDNQVTSGDGSAATTESSIFRLDNEGNVVQDQGPGPYAPIWQVSPATNANMGSIMYNSMSDPARNHTLSIMLETKHAQVSEILNPESSTPSSVLYFPVGNEFDATASIVGTTSIEFKWQDVFRQALPMDNAAIVVVLENTYGQEFTFVVEGQDVFLLGAGDLHDSRFDDMEEVVTYNSFLFHTSVNASFGETNIFTDSGDSRRTQQQEQQQKQLEGCLYAIRIYPSHDFQAEYMTSRPILYSISVAMIFVFTSAVFMAYECLAGRQQGVVMETLARSSAIVHNLFPENVRDRMLLDAQRNIKRRKRRRSSLTDGLIRQRFSYVHGDTPRLKLMSFLKGSKETYSKMEDPELQASTTSEPIADFFPNTTVMFADIAGFTAWSSDREPSEVFHLLETVWSSFDAIAKRLGVFKIETVGDCYVCVTGLPDPNKDHAIIMTRFAYECLHKMKELTQSLEVELGPGTTDLAMRFGLHSGPVTAGVLRGEKARFQLFGDTMNTAARMESTGQKNRVQISQTTADLLTEGGKEHWFVPRENLITAKGKGQMQTYWVKHSRMKQRGEGRSRRRMSQRMKTAEELVATNSPNEYDYEKTGDRREEIGQWMSKSMMTLESTIDSALAGDKTSRLVDWNVEILMGHLAKVVKKRERVVPIYTGGCIVEEVVNRPSGKDAQFNSARSIRLRIDDKVKMELHDFVTRIAEQYRDVPFHNFEHASHVAMTANNLMKRIVDKDDSEQPRKSTFGIRSDPLSHFAVVFSALVHDVDHKGLTNGQVTSEQEDSMSVSKPSSMELTWELLMETRYKHLRSCIYADAFERARFRQFLINCVKATDVTDMDLRALRLKRWNAAFNSASSPTTLTPQEVNSRKATIVIELIMQTASAAHYSQHWEMFLKWNELLFTEMYETYQRGGSSRDPSEKWYENEILFFDNHVIPLAKMIKVCGVFAGSNEECLTYALQNRKEWERKGRELCKDMVERLAKDEKGGTMA